MSQIVQNGSFEIGASAPGTGWTFSQTAASGAVSFSTEAVDGERGLQITLTPSGVGAEAYISQSITSGFSVGDRLSFLIFKHLSVRSVSNGALTIKVQALTSAGLLVETLIEQSYTSLDTALTSFPYETTPIPENTSSLYVYIGADCLSDTTGTLTFVVDYVMMDVIAGASQGNASGGVASGASHDVAFKYDDSIGVVGFDLLRDKDNRLAYFQEEAPIFGDPKTQSDSSASDFTMWRSTNQTSFSDGMGQIDFDLEDGAAKFLLLENGRVTDSGFVVRGPLVTSGSLPSDWVEQTEENLPEIRSTTVYDSNGNPIWQLGAGKNWVYSLNNGLTFTHMSGSPWSSGITDLVAFKQLVYAAFGNATDAYVTTGIGLTATTVVTGIKAGFWGSGEGNLIRIKPDTNGIINTLESSTDGTVYANTKQYDDGVRNATGSLSPGFYQGLFYFGAPDGLYSWDGDDSAASSALVLSFSTAASSNNAQRIKLFRGKIYFTISNDAVYEFDGATAPTRITLPWSTEIIAPSHAIYEGTISHIDIETTAFKLYAAINCVDNSDTKFSLLMSYDGLAWVIEHKHEGAWLQLCTFDGVNRIWMLPFPNPDKLIYSMSADRALPVAEQDRAGITTFRSSLIDLQRPLIDKLVSGVYLRCHDITPKFETQMSAASLVGDSFITVADTSSINAGDWVWVDPLGDHPEVFYVDHVSGIEIHFTTPPSTYGTTNITGVAITAHTGGSTVVKVQGLVSLYDLKTATDTIIGGVYDDTVGDQLITLPEESPFTSKKFEVRVRMVGTDLTSVNMELREWAVRYIYLPEAKRRWRITLNLREGHQRLDHSIEQRSASTMMAQVWAAKGARRLVRFYDIDGNSYLGRLGQPEFRVEETKDESTGTSIKTIVCVMSFVETDAELVK